MKHQSVCSSHASARAVPPGLLAGVRLGVASSSPLSRRGSRRGRFDPSRRNPGFLNCLFSRPWSQRMPGAYPGFGGGGETESHRARAVHPQLVSRGEAFGSSSQSVQRPSKSGLGVGLGGASLLGADNGRRVRIPEPPFNTSSRGPDDPVM